MTTVRPRRPAARTREIAPFHVVELLTRARELESQGRSIIHMEVGEPDFPTPEPIVMAAQAFLSGGRVFYTPSLGIPALREAIARFYLDRYQVGIGAERVIVTAGASGALLLAAAALIDPGDEILMADPGYPCNRHFVRCFEGRARGVDVGPESAYQLTPEAVEAAWSERTRGVLIASPANPTGTLIPTPQLARIAEIAARRGAALLVDEIYHGLTYGADAATALAVAPEAIVINSFSKYFGMTGWRLGWMVVPDAQFAREVEKLAQNLFIAPSAPAQYGALAAFEPSTIALLEARRCEFQRRRDFLLPALRALGFGLRVEPQGAFYLYADASGLGFDSHVLAWRLLEEAGVATTPGVDFGAHRAGDHLRFAYTTSIERLQEAVERIGRWLALNRM